MIKVNNSTTKLKDKGNDIFIKKDTNTNNFNIYDKKYKLSINLVYDLYII